ncbi:MAG: PAS domain S-box protein [Acidobacteriota bacterium]|nr:PAS domain S-box protein [Acidobacteriota bacterium]
MDSDVRSLEAALRARCVELEQACSEAELRNAALMKAVPDILMEVNQDKIYTRANPAGMDFFGDDVIGRHASEFFVGEQDTLDKVDPLFKGEVDEIHLQSRQRRKDGSVRILSWHCRALPAEDGRIVGALSSARDITDLKAGELARAESEALKSAVVDNSMDGIITIDQNGIVMSFNKAAEQLFGYSPEEVIGNNVTVLMPAPYKDEHDGYLKNYLATGKAHIIGKGREVTARRKDGSTFPFFLTVSREIVVGSRTFFIGLIRDLTKEKQVEAQLRQAQKMESMGTLAGGIAHDFNNILGGVIAYAELMLEDAEEGSYLHDDLKEMLNGCNRARDLVQQILTFSRQDKPKREPLYLHPIIKESLKLMRASIPSTVEIQRRIDVECPPVIADVTQIHQVMMNLCANAQYAMRDEGGILGVGLDLVEINEEYSPVGLHLAFGSYVRLTISDTGVGMDEETRSRIFEPFFTTKSVGEGTGMGLSVVHGIVKNHGGDIVVDSIHGEGTCFQVFFPVWEEEAPVVRGEANHLQKGSGQILLVDDDQFLLKAQRRILERHGYQVCTYADSEQALERFMRNPGHFDLVITDQTMPRLTGLDLARVMLDTRPNLPVILTTGFSDVVSPDRAHEAGICEFLMKPVSKEVLLETLRKQLA